MRVRLAVALALVIHGTGNGVFAQSAATCVQSFQQRKMEMVRFAQQCDVSAAELGSVDAGHNALSPQECSYPIGVVSQLSAFNECARVYVCAIQTYNCAIRKVEGGWDCQTAAASCLAEYPVPQ